jgi:hypothetical protein
MPAPKQSSPHVCFITSKRRMLEARMIFGIYCEVSIETLRQIKLKYIEDYESLVQFLTDFHLIKDRPSILAIDGLDFYLEQKNLGPLTKQMRLHYLLTLVKNCQQFLDNT